MGALFGHLPVAWLHEGKNILDILQELNELHRGTPDIPAGLYDLCLHGLPERDNVHILMSPLAPQSVQYLIELRGYKVHALHSAYTVDSAEELHDVLVFMTNGTEKDTLKRKYAPRYVSREKPKLVGSLFG